MSRRTHFPKTGEDRQLDAYWRATLRGPLFTEVRLAGSAWTARPWASLAKDGAVTDRRLDGVIVEGEPVEVDDAVRGHQAFAKSVPRWREEGRACEVIEVKPGLSEWVLGQALVGRWLFERQVGLPISRTTVLARHQDPAMVWAAGKLRIETANPRQPPKQVPMRSRFHYGLHDAQLQRIERYRRELGGEGTWLTRVPLAGPAWKPDGGKASAAQTYVPFMRVPGESSAGVIVFEPRHRSLLDAEALDLVCVGRRKLGRGALGLVASYSLFFEQQYGRAPSKCTIICGQTDLAVEAACRAIGGTMRIPPVDVVEVGEVGAADPEAS